MIGLTSKAIFVTFTIWIYFAMHCTNCYELSLHYVYMDEDKLSIPSPKYCSENFPYTFSKCSRLCLTDLNATCLDDQLCYCSSEIDEGYKETNELSQSLHDFAGTNVLCNPSQFCADLCQYDEKLFELVQGLHYANATGTLCKLPADEINEEIESCVCYIQL